MFFHLSLVFCALFFLSCFLLHSLVIFIISPCAHASSPTLRHVQVIVRGLIFLPFWLAYIFLSLCVPTRLARPILAGLERAREYVAEPQFYKSPYQGDATVQLTSQALHHPIFQLTAQQLAEHIKQRKYSVSFVVDLFIQRIEAMNPHVKAVCYNTYETARQEAALYDHILSHLYGESPASPPSPPLLHTVVNCPYHADSFQHLSELPPFFGVPMLSKECFALAGYPHSSGLIHRAQVQAARNATSLARLKQAGCVVLASTNVSELCMWLESHNVVYGCTNSAYSHTRTSGGSSGGAAALLALKGAPFALASDVGGSIRLPANFNGVFGHKPSGGAVPNVGQHPPSPGPLEQVCQTGPLTRFAADLFPLLRVLAGPDGTRGEHLRMPWLPPLSTLQPAHVEIDQLNVYLLDSFPVPGSSPVAREVTAALERVFAHFAAQGCAVRRLAVPELSDAFLVWSHAMKQGGADPFARQLKLGEQKHEAASAETTPTTTSTPSSSSPPSPSGSESDSWIYYEIWKHFACMSVEHTLPALLLGVFEKLDRLTPVSMQRRIEEKSLKLKLLFELLLDGQINVATEDGLHLPPYSLHTSQLPQLIQSSAHVRKTPSILLCPVYPIPAPLHGWPLLRPFNFVYTGLFNALLLPATAVPLAPTFTGISHVPIGLQIIAPFARDHISIAAAMHLEEAGIAKATTPHD